MREINHLQDQLSRLQEILASLSGVTYSLLHDNHATDLTGEYEPLTRAKRQGLYLAQKNLLVLAENEMESLNTQIRRYTKAYATLRSQQKNDKMESRPEIDPVEKMAPMPPPVAEINADKLDWVKSEAGA